MAATPQKKNFIPTVPDYNVSALCKKTDKKSNIGCAWKNEDGRITIKLNAFVCLDSYEQDLVIALFPIKKGGKGGPPQLDEAPEYHSGGDDQAF